MSPASPVVNNVESVKLPFNWILGTVNLIQIVDFITWSHIIARQLKELLGWVHVEDACQSLRN